MLEMSIPFESDYSNNQIVVFNFDKLTPMAKIDNV